jgi:hypothetical protein
VNRSIVVVFAGLVLAALAHVVTPVAAEHTVYYRYVVLGFVRDAQGKPLTERPVEVIRDKTGLTYSGRSDGAGFFVLVVRLGDESAGETLTLRIGSATTRITARFDPANHTDDRGTRVDLEGSRWVERTTAFRPTLARYVRNDRH